MNISAEPGGPSLLRSTPRSSPRSLTEVNDSSTLTSSPRSPREVSRSNQDARPVPQTEEIPVHMSLPSSCPRSPAEVRDLPRSTPESHPRSPTEVRNLPRSTLESHPRSPSEVSPQSRPRARPVVFYINYHSTPEEVQRWLEHKGFSKRLVRAEYITTVHKTDNYDKTRTPFKSSLIKLKSNKYFLLN